MIRQSLTVLAVILFAGSIVAWFVEPDHRDYWLLLLVLSIAVSMVSARLHGLERRLEKLEGPPGS